MPATNLQTNIIRQGFSLVEILISLLVLSGAVATMFSGFETAGKLNFYAQFESEAAMLAEREIELLKADILNKQRSAGPASAPSRFQLKPGWKIINVWTAHDSEKCIRIVCTVTQAERVLKVESFLYAPEASR